MFLSFVTFVACYIPYLELRALTRSRPCAATDCQHRYAAGRECGRIATTSLSGTTSVCTGSFRQSMDSPGSLDRDKIIIDEFLERGGFGC